MRDCMRNIRPLFILIICLFCFWVNMFASDGTRNVLNMNREWKYIKGDIKGAELPDYDDGEWENIGLPHSFSIPYFMSKDCYVGYGWYRKSFYISKDDLHKKSFLEFEGVFQDAEIFVNGINVGRHIGGYTGFSVDITSALRAGKNLLAVRVNNIWRPDIAPRAGEHVFSGGIYRNVWLVTKEKSYIVWNGISVSTPELASNEGKSSSVRIGVEFRNDNQHGNSYNIVARVIDNEGKTVASASAEVFLVSGECKKVVLNTGMIHSPKLWSNDTPSLYKVVSMLYNGEELVDSLTTTFGFRWVEWTKDRGFYLNGKHLYIRGVNVHQDQAGWGDAVTESAARRDVAMMKEAGFNMIRGSHYPHSSAFSRACDEMGMLLWSEAPFWGIGGFKHDGYWNSSAYPVDSIHARNFEESALKQLEEMILIHRNHPSIIAWSMCNEAFFSDTEALPGVKRLLKRMVELSHRLDSTRVAAIGGAQRPLGNGRIDMIGDIAGYNGDGATQPDFQNPGIPNMVSEYGSVTSDRPGRYSPQWGDLQRNEAWKGVSWRSGQAIWCGFDHGSIAGSALGKMGIVDYFRIPKRSWYWYRNEYGGICPPEWPSENKAVAIKLEANKYEGINTDGTDDVFLNVTVVDDSEKPVMHSPVVELKIVSGPGEFPTGRKITFSPDSDIRIMDGQAAISLRSYYAGRTIIEASSPGLEEMSIILNFVGDNKYVEGKTINVQDRPYIRYIREENNGGVQTFGRYNPVFASSYREGFVPGMAADGINETCWRAISSDLEPYWLLDTEKKLVMTETEIVFPENVIPDCIVEISDDRINWKSLDRIASKKQLGNKVLFTAEGESVLLRFLRVRFDNGESACLSDIQVKGIVQE